MEKQSLVLLPGLLNDTRLWQPQITALADIADIIVGDTTTANSMPAMAASVLAQVPTETFAMAGLSMGGYIALEIMRQAPQRVTGLALLDTNAQADSAEATAARKKAMELANTDFQAVLNGLFVKQLHPTHLHNDSLLAVMNAMGHSLGASVFLKQQQAIMHRIDSRPSLAAITCPTLILCGRDDVITPVAIHEDMHAAIKSSTLTVVYECGHLSTLEQPVAVTSAMREWLMSISKNKY